jgi:hypothetical protein
VITALMDVRVQYMYCPSQARKSVETSTCTPMSTVHTKHVMWVGLKCLHMAGSLKVFLEGSGVLNR